MYCTDGSKCVLNCKAKRLCEAGNPNDIKSQKIIELQKRITEQEKELSCKAKSVRIRDGG